MTTHAYWTEIWQLVAAAIGTLASLWNTWDALRDVSAVGDENGLRSTALNNARNEGVRFVEMLLFLVIGVISVVFAPPPSPGLEAGQAVVLIRIMLIIITVLLMVASLADRADRLFQFRRYTANRYQRRAADAAPVPAASLAVAPAPTPVDSTADGVARVHLEAAKVQVTAAATQAEAEAQQVAAAAPRAVDPGDTDLSIQGKI